MTAQHLKLAAAGLAIAWVAYSLGKQAAAQPAGQANEITDSGQWWSYAGQWA
jgi:hypothetical protein